MFYISFFGHTPNATFPLYLCNRFPFHLSMRPLQVVFITEYMSSGSLKKFLKLTKRNVKKLPLQSWKRWCTQILSALRCVDCALPEVLTRLGDRDVRRLLPCLFKGSLYMLSPQHKLKE